MLRQYLPILIFMGLAGVLGLALFTIGWILGPRRPDAEKLSPYECGFEAFEDSRMCFDVRYYLVAIIFIVFDLEIAFFFPWAVSLRSTGSFSPHGPQPELPTAPRGRCRPPARRFPGPHPPIGRVQ